MFLHERPIELWAQVRSKEPATPVIRKGQSIEKGPDSVVSSPTNSWLGGAGFNPKFNMVREWCQTEQIWAARNPGPAAGVPACPTAGMCDEPAVRDSWIPGGSTPIRSLRIHFNVFANNDGTNPAATQADVDAQVVQLNSDFAASKIEFCATTSFINNTTFRGFSDSEETAMKLAYAHDPAHHLNVYVVNILGGYIGVGTFPWDPAALAFPGGLIIDDDFFGAFQKTLTHEVGHCVGLWHTHHGVSEVATCSDCWERADGINGDVTGDFAADTAPTPVNYDCAPPGGTDPCSAISWGVTDTQNYMGYAPDFCYTEFSAQQFGRMHCWSEQVLQAWQCGPIISTGGCCDGTTCTIESQTDCEAIPGSYLGDDTDCDPPPGPSSTYSAAPNIAIPDNGGPANPAVHTINVPDSFAIGDVDVRVTITHTWIGDLIVTLEHDGDTVAVVDRPGYDGVNFGCDANNFSNIRLDDDGTLPIQFMCANNLTSPPNYQPNQPLAAFQGGNAAGAWTIRVSDNAGQDTGSLNAWSLIISLPGPGPCCAASEDCDDGNVCNGLESCVSSACVSGSPLVCDDGNLCTVDTCVPPTGCEASGVGVSGPCDDGDPCTGPDACQGDLAGTCVGPPFDSDGDTVPDCSDICPGENDLLDCDNDTVPDACDNEPDCNNNNVPDNCDIASATSNDTNGNGIPDECELPAPQPVPGEAIKNRFLTFRMPQFPAAGPVIPMAIRVTLVELHNPDPPQAPCCPAPDFSAYEGQVRWVGEPIEYPESLSGGGTVQVSHLQCAPHSRGDWFALGDIHVTGAEIVPSSEYLLHSADEFSGVTSPTGLTLLTTRWGDVTAPFNPPDTSTQPDFVDVSAIVDKFKNVPGALSKVRVQLQPRVPNPNDDISFLDISACVDAFKGIAFPDIWGPCTCPSSESCPTLDACGRCEP